MHAAVEARAGRHTLDRGVGGLRSRLDKEASSDLSFTIESRCNATRTPSDSIVWTQQRLTDRTGVCTQYDSGSSACTNARACTQPASHNSSSQCVTRGPPIHHVRLSGSPLTSKRAASTVATLATPSSTPMQSSGARQPAPVRCSPFSPPPASKLSTSTSIAGCCRTALGCEISCFLHLGQLFLFHAEWVVDSFHLDAIVTDA